MTTEAGEVHELVEHRLRAADQMYTRGRRELVDLLLELGRPASMPELLELGPSLTQSSVYRNMIDLEAVGIISKIAGTDDRARYELAEELIGHHHHLICTECGLVGDFVVPDRIERHIEADLDAALTETGFHAQTHRLDVLGICADCA